MEPRPAERFVVTSVIGYGGEGGNESRLATKYQVLDSAYCYETVYESFDRKLIENGAAVLNGGDLAWPHGHLRTIWGAAGGRVQKACKCEVCRAKRIGHERVLKRIRLARRRK